MTTPEPEKLPLPAPEAAVTDADNAVQGEGDYEAARRHRESVEAFVASGQVEAAAHAAAPDNDQEAQAMQQAEAAGLAHAKK